jgi:hypothetical protein
LDITITDIIFIHIIKGGRGTTLLFLKKKRVN